MKIQLRRFAVVGAAVSSFVAAALVAAPAASASNYQGCWTGEVCFYPDYSWWINDSPSWYYDGAIDTWVDLTSDTGAYGAAYIRNQYADHSVLIRYVRVSTGATESHCMEPETTALFGKPNEDNTLGYIVNGLKVKNVATC